MRNPLEQTLAPRVNPIWRPVAAVVLCLGALAPAYAADQARELAEFKSINSTGAFSVVVNVGQKQSVVVSGSDAVLARVGTQVVDGVLLLSTTERTHFSGDDKARIVINVQRLDQYRMEGAGKTDLNNVQGERFKLYYQGVGMLRVSGKVQTFILDAEGVGAIDARDLVAQHADVSLQGVGSVQVRATESLRAKVDGIGSLTYFGKPSRISKSVDGIGHIAAGE